MPADRLPRRPPPRALHYVVHLLAGALCGVRNRRALHVTPNAALVTCPKCKAALASATAPQGKERAMTDLEYALTLLATAPPAERPVVARWLAMLVVADADGLSQRDPALYQRARDAVVQSVYATLDARLHADNAP